jgi:drug/metabolite transporter (DMT)-like permease
MAIFFAIISGVSGYCYSVESAEFSKINNLTTSQILATRFWLLLIFSTAIVYIKGDNLVNSKILFYSCLVGLSTFIIPIYLFQHGVLKLGASRNAIIRGFTPVTTFIIQYIIHIRYSLIEFIVSIIFSIALVFSIIKAK